MPRPTGSKNKIDKRIKKACLICGGSFYTIPAREKNGRGKYCSKKCLSKSFKKEKIEMTCKKCGKKFLLRKARLKHTEGKFCSRSCASSIKRTDYRCEDCGKELVNNTVKRCRKCFNKYAIRENSNNWKGGITPLIMKVRGCFKYRQWKSDIFTKDNFTCQECGDGKNGNLEAHHIDKFSDIMARNKITTYEQAIECEELWNINNGLTLCRGCHQLEHKK